MASAKAMGVPLLVEGLGKASWSRIWMGLHLLVPPLTLLLIANLLGWAMLALLSLIGGPAMPVLVSSAMLAAILVAVLAAWMTAGRPVLAGGTLLRLPLYVLWKLALYAKLAKRKEAGTWTRTERVD